MFGKRFFVVLALACATLFGGLVSCSVHARPFVPLCAINALSVDGGVGPGEYALSFASATTTTGFNLGSVTTADEYTFEAFITPSGGTDSHIFNLGDTDNTGLLNIYYSSAYAAFRWDFWFYSIGHDDDFWPSGDIKVTVVHTATSFDMYVNGVVEFSGPTAEYIYSGDWWIGNDGTTANAFTGIFHDIAVYNYAKDSATILSEADRIPQTEDSGLLALAFTVPAGMRPEGSTKIAPSNCMYDSVSDRLVYNQGTGSLTVENLQTVSAGEYTP